MTLNKLRLLFWLLTLSFFSPAWAADPLSFDPNAQDNPYTAPRQKRTAPEETTRPAPAPPPYDYSSQWHAPPPVKPFKSHVWEFRDNPDRFPSVLLSENAAETVNGHVDTLLNGVAKTHGEKTFSGSYSLASVLPLADWVSLTLAGGINLNEFQADQTQEFVATVNDNSVGTYLATLQFYIVHASPFGDTRDNPDRWPSIGISGSGSTSIQYDVTDAINNINQPLNTQTWSLALNTRLPLCGWYTILPTLTGLYSQSQTQEVPTLAGTVTHLRSLGGSIEQRFYLTGKNLLYDDKGLNPDRWTSFYFNVGGLDAVSGDQSIESLGVGLSRPDRSQSFNSALGVRLPMTSHATLRLEFDAAYSNGYTPQIGATVGSSHTHTTSLGGLAALRYYLF